MAVTSLALSRSMPLKLAPGTAIIAILAWSVITMMPPTTEGFPMDSFVAALTVGVSGQVIARIVRTSAGLYTTTAVYVLVPGFATYLAMAAFAAGDTEVGIDLLVRALTISAAIAAGVTLGVALTRKVPVPRTRSSRTAG
ncbi:MAG: threonine/serine exporter family protein [Microthrixaceae bacterium]|nr:threonine/serine exporter family protein [Microthrixaceae bacterium]